MHVLGNTHGRLSWDRVNLENYMFTQPKETDVPSFSPGSDCQLTDRRLGELRIWHEPVGSHMRRELRIAMVV